MFIPQQQLDAAELEHRSATTRAPRGGANGWEAPVGRQYGVCVCARPVQRRRLIEWSSSPQGTIFYLFCVSAPVLALFRSVADLRRHSKKLPHCSGPDKRIAAGPVKSRPAAEPVAWVRWTDPREGAFSATVPQGWNVTGGAFRQSATDMRQSLVAVSPDGQIRVAVGDANTGIYTTPTPTYMRYGIREGDIR